MISRTAVPAAGVPDTGRRPTVAFVLHDDGLTGAERSAVDLAEVLVASGMALHAIIPRTDGPLAAAFRAVGADVEIVPPLPWWFEIPGERGRAEDHGFDPTPVVDVLRRVRPDVVVTQTAVIPHAALAAAALGIPHVWNIREFGDRDHGLLLPAAPREIGSVMRGLSVTVTAVSRAVRKHFFGDDAEEVVILSGVPRLDGGAVQRAEDGRPWTLGVVGSLHSGKGQADVVRAVALLRERGRDVPLLLFGSGSPASTARLVELIAELGVDDLVELRGWSGRREAFAAIDAVAVTSRAEAFGRVPFEAATAGRPVVYTASGGLPEILEPDLTGLAYPPGDAEALAAQVDRLAEDPALGEALVAAARTSLLDPARRAAVEELWVRIVTEAADRTPPFSARFAAVQQVEAVERRTAELRDALRARVAAHEALQVTHDAVEDALAQRTRAHELLLEEHDELARQNARLLDEIAASNLERPGG